MPLEWGFKRASRMMPLVLFPELRHWKNHPDLSQAGVHGIRGRLEVTTYWSACIEALLLESL